MSAFGPIEKTSHENMHLYSALSVPFKFISLPSYVAYIKARHLKM